MTTVSSCSSSVDAFVVGEDSACGLGATCMDHECRPRVEKCEFDVGPYRPTQQLRNKIMFRLHARG